jgi:hypothetical protein
VTAPYPNNQETPRLRILSTIKKNIANIVQKMKTSTTDTAASRRDGHVTLDISCFTCRTN